MEFEFKVKATPAEATQFFGAFLRQVSMRPSRDGSVAITFQPNEPTPLLQQNCTTLDAVTGLEVLQQIQGQGVRPALDAAINRAQSALAPAAPPVVGGQNPAMDAQLQQLMTLLQQHPEHPALNHPALRALAATVVAQPQPQAQEEDDSTVAAEEEHTDSVWAPLDRFLGPMDRFTGLLLDRLPPPMRIAVPVIFFGACLGFVLVKTPPLTHFLGLDALLSSFAAWVNPPPPSTDAATEQESGAGKASPSPTPSSSTRGKKGAQPIPQNAAPPPFPAL